MGHNFNSLLAQAERRHRDCPQDMRPISEVVKSLADGLDLPSLPVVHDFTASTTTKKQSRADALLKMPVLGVCSGCGRDAVHRHSPSNHAIPGDVFGLCERCHRFVHEGLSSWRPV